MTDLFTVFEQGPLWLIVARYVFLLVAMLGLFVLWGVTR